MTYSEKRHTLKASAAYPRAIKIMGAACACYALVVGGVVAFSAARTGPGGLSGPVVMDVLHWFLVAALMFLGCLVVLTFVAPALMTEARLRKLAPKR